jgi:hypothetical protein
MHHLVQQGVLYLGPGMAGDVPAADGDLQRLSGSGVHAQLPQPCSHAAREPDGHSPEGAVEVLAVEPLVGLAQAVKQEQIARARPLAPRRPWTSRGMPLHRKVEELALRHSPHRPRHAWVEESDDGPEDPVRRVGIASMQSQYSSGAEAYHDDPIGVGDDSGDAAKAELAQAGGQGIRAHNP